MTKHTCAREIDERDGNEDTTQENPGKYSRFCAPSQLLLQRLKSGISHPANGAFHVASVPQAVNITIEICEARMREKRKQGRITLSICEVDAFTAIRDQRRHFCAASPRRRTVGPKTCLSGQNLSFLKKETPRAPKPHTVFFENKESQGGEGILSAQANMRVLTFVLFREKYFFYARYIKKLIQSDQPNPCLDIGERIF